MSWIKTDLGMVSSIDPRIRAAGYNLELLRIAASSGDLCARIHSLRKQVALDPQAQEHITGSYSVEMLRLTMIAEEIRSRLSAAREKC